MGSALALACISALCYLLSQTNKRVEALEIEVYELKKQLEGRE